MLYKNAICAGTFDNLHKGHTAYLQFAFSVAEKVYIAITSDMYTQKNKSSVQSFTKRKTNIENFLQENNFANRSEIVAINDAYGIAIDPLYSFDALIVSEETLPGGEKVNEKRKLLGLAPLAIVVAPLVPNEIGLKISSSDLRQKLTDEEGKLLIKNNVLHTTLHMPESLRHNLQEPFGSIYNSATNLSSAKLIAVGDVTTQKLHALGYTPLICCIDFVVERKKQDNTLSALGFTGEEIAFFATNPPSSLTPSLWDVVEKALFRSIKNEKSIIIVAGEEDLAVIPLLLLAPIGFTICYGQPHVGMVVVPVTKDSKSQVLSLLHAFQEDSTRGH